MHPNNLIRANIIFSFNYFILKFTLRATLLSNTCDMNVSKRGKYYGGGIRTIEFDSGLKKLKIAMFREAITREVAILGKRSL